MRRRSTPICPDTLILGACNPQMAYKAIEIRTQGRRDAAVQRDPPGSGRRAIEISAVDPQASMAGHQNERLIAVAGEVRDHAAEAIRAV